MQSILVRSTVNRHDVDWWGYWVAAPTPFLPDGGLDEPALRAVLSLYAEQGVSGVLVNGSTGEWFSQTPAERRLGWPGRRRRARGPMPVVIGVSAYAAAEAPASPARGRGGGERRACRPPRTRAWRPPRSSSSTGSSAGCWAAVHRLQLAARSVAVDMEPAPACLPSCRARAGRSDQGRRRRTCSACWTRSRG